ncbi:RagB/SusD family nutrient uptake outer membrane protein [Chitinophaga sp. sic0106]|uniref:RagB/SusD family nutrient uptake outer membrane protein n=1 Tax=Chitinophaga sp. sic0106 TaxID=2854785 RepID=UPI001C46BCC0|nr:RagB/SusD family nutrient uptake outer membrane protein [Chitinophaga sp. sic0106]MBV7532150.1 RagB/SusD family nutrient uptake outer membrane protein [Chitinophaga sp. sic0106]
MKHLHKKIFTGLLASSLLFGCSKDYLERDNPTATTDDKWWRLESDLFNYLEVIYNNQMSPGALITSSSYQANCRMHMSGITDESVFRANFGSWNSYPLGAVTTTDGYLSDTYRQNYKDIRNASRILENYSRIYMESAVVKEQRAAEARALRARAHLNLFLFYGAIPIVSKSLEPAEGASVPRNTAEEVVKFVSTELDSAAEVLPTTYASSEAYRISKGACYAMQVQLFLSVKNYPKVIEYAKKLIALNVYDLHYSTTAGVNSYAQLFSYDALENKERIMFRRTGNSGAFFRLAPKSLSGQACNGPTATMVNSYETLQGKTPEELGADSLAVYWKNPLYKNNRDPRLAASVLFPGQTFVNRLLDPFTSGSVDQIGAAQSTQTGYWVKKYLDPKDVSRNNSGTLNFMITRYAEILLSYVEALVESDDWQNPDVLLYLNKIRNRAGMPNVNTAVYNTQEKMRALYRRERKVELAFEGTRLFDIRRWQIGAEVLNGPAMGAINPNTNQPVIVETRVFDAGRDYLWPIPLTEINGNPAMVQNPKW